LRFLKIQTRRRGLLILALGITIFCIGGLLPAKETRVAAPLTHIDEFVPVYQFSEFHSTRVAASKEQVARAIKSVTADDIFSYRTLAWMRRLGRSGPESILNPPPDQPLLDVATRTSFILLAEDPNREIVLGTLVEAPEGWQPSEKATPESFKAFHQPGFVLAGMNFRIEDEVPGTCIVTTETRVYATDPHTLRSFARYWRAIYPGSALIRRMWLRAIVRRAESPK
jgi:hypothetical protein